MRSSPKPAISKVCDDLERVGFRLKERDALEAFAREGDWHTIHYAARMRSLEAWEINASHIPNLRRNLPLSTIRNVDSISFATTYRRKFDLIVVDNPQGLFGPASKYCEHFDFLPLAINMLRDPGAIVFNINVRPYDYGLHPEWQERRERFYQGMNTSDLELEALLRHYTSIFGCAGWSVRYSKCYRRSSFLYYAMFLLMKI